MAFERLPKNLELHLLGTLCGSVVLELLHSNILKPSARVNQYLGALNEFGLHRGYVPC